MKYPEVGQGQARNLSSSVLESSHSTNHKRSIQPSRQSIHSRLGPQGVSFTSHRSSQLGKRKETIVQSDSSSTGGPQNPSPARNPSHTPQPRHRRAERVEEQPRPNEPWFKLPKQSKGDTSKLDHTKYYAFHRGPGHTTTNCYTWKNYLEKLVKEGKVDRYLDKPAEQPKRNADGDEEPPTKMIRINGIFAESEHLGATNNSKKRKIQQALLISQVQAVDTQLGPIIGFTEQDAEGVDFPHDDALVVSVQLAHAIVDRMMVDNGSAVNLLQLSVIQKMGLESTIIRRAEQLEKTAKIGSRLSPGEKEELTIFLRENRDVFAWSPSDMPGIDPKVACHKLHVNPIAKPVIQKRRHFAPERMAIIEAEIDKLLEAGFI
nr:uncharacterized protein LOC114825272 [Malus domestica]